MTNCYTQGERYEVEDPHDTDDLSREVASSFSGSTSLEATKGPRATRCSETGAAQSSHVLLAWT